MVWMIDMTSIDRTEGEEVWIETIGHCMSILHFYI